MRSLGTGYSKNSSIIAITNYCVVLYLIPISETCQEIPQWYQ